MLLTQVSTEIVQKIIIDLINASFGIFEWNLTKDVRNILYEQKQCVDADLLLSEISSLVCEEKVKYVKYQTPTGLIVTIYLPEKTKFLH